MCGRLRTRSLCLLSEMNDSDKAVSAVSRVALSWLAWLFHVPVESLDYSKRIGSDLKPSAGSFYGDETFDVLIEDVDDIKKALEQAGLRKESELTVGDFCGLVERLDEVNPDSCKRLLRSWERIMTRDKRPKWRRMLFRTIGF